MEVGKELEGEVKFKRSRSSGSMKVRDQEPEYTVKKNGKTFKYAEDQDGNLRITDVEAEGEDIEPSPNLLERLRRADFKSCDKCLTAEMNRSLFKFMFFSLLDTEEDL